MTASEEESHNLIFLTLGLVAGMLSAIAVKVFSDVSPEFRYVLPGNVVDPAGIFYIIFIVVGIGLYIRPGSLSRDVVNTMLLIFSGFLILFGITMIGITTS